MFASEDGSRPKAVMVAVQLPGVSDLELASSLAELRRLARTLGLDVIGQVTQRRSNLAAGKVLGEGKLRELAGWTGGSGEVPRYSKPGSKSDPIEPEPEPEPEPDPDPGSGSGSGSGSGKATVVLVDHDLTPTQQRNLERATDAEVHDRTSVIIGIFHRHARSREARLQVEIARLTYLAPRLREGGGGGDRVRGGVGGKGAGETSLELDRRRIRDRIAELRRELASIEDTAEVQRGARDHLPRAALVGYTNAGKSSLMRALTGSEVYVADKLFATLDTTVRVIAPRTEPPILITDTVGFVKKLPHDLVASFRSTLRESGEAALVIHIVDASDPAMRDHIRVTREVVGELGGGQQAAWMVLNKIDRVSDEQREDLALAFPDAILMSARSRDDVSALRERLVSHFLGEPEEMELFVPWDQHGKLVHQLREQCRIVSEDYAEEGARIRLRGPRSVLDRLRDS